MGEERAIAEWWVESVDKRDRVLDYNASILALNRILAVQCNAILETLKQHQTVLKDFGVKRLGCAIASFIWVGCAR